MARTTERIELCRPHLVLTNIRGNVRIITQKLTYTFDDPLRLDVVGVFTVRERMKLFKVLNEQGVFSELSPVSAPNMTGLDAIYRLIQGTYMGGEDIGASSEEEGQE